ncbi:methyltransferase domain-containing protein [Actinoalloteichus hymeniacidonis]|uniref:Methyltransferase domain n=1 Tax=Actinoalloteichus hymeniacidonis TaxID=340345 RepID=A0AAC9HMF1_9PSEU|nr:class I SAM-dependent methyltransferase [Actinoalloteichus hymeniacidonis]AOS61999.1 Methyltransferase domain [Actinoalloteichus hymeniacidonis]MBB5909979.1 SAM-dependent methyltransferase [Actinoalloteichus hymeniacidonis]
MGTVIDPLRTSGKQQDPRRVDTHTAWGEYWANIHDEWMGPEIDDDCLETLVSLAGDGKVLELGLGTGRVALPLVRAGLEVHGFELAEEMLEKLLEKPDADRIRVFKKNYINEKGDGLYRLIPWIDWGPFVLHSQEEQTRCVQNAADQLEPGGYLIVELPTRLPLPAPIGDDNQHLLVESINTTSVGLWAVDYNPIDQTMFTQQVLLENGSVTVRPVRMRYLTPPELDLMAQLAGLQVAHRWSDWRRSPVTTASNNQIVVYQKPLTD